MVEEANSEKASDSELEAFITVPVDEGLIFTSLGQLLGWLNKDKKIFDGFVSVNKYTGNDYSSQLSIFISEYYKFYEVLLKNASNLYEKQILAEKALLHINFEDGKKDFIGLFKACSDKGFFPMQGSIGMCAAGMSRVQPSLPASWPSHLPDVPQGIGWLYAMAVLRKQQSEQEISTADIKLNVEAGRDQINALQKDIEEAQNKVVKYKKELDEFQKNALKSAALKSPANSLGKLESAHLKAARWWLSLAGIVAIGWFTYIYCYYFPDIMKPLLNDSTNLYALWGMGLTSLISAGIVTTSLVILLRLAIARINFGVAAGERKTMAMAFRALLLKNAISEDQQMLFLQNIVGSKLPDYVNCNDVHLPADELAKIVQAASNGKKD